MSSPLSRPVSCFCILFLHRNRTGILIDFFYLRSKEEILHAYCSVLSVSSASVMLYSSGSDHIFQTGLSESCLAPVLRYWFIYFALCHKDQFQVHACMADLADVVQNCHVNFHSFADYSQIYLHCQLSGVPSAVRKLEDCISEVGHWMSANRLKLNTDKTELLWIGKAQADHIWRLCSITPA